ncbi:ENDOU [Branchiostoma lanceolatum]|uniref:Uridylate-specific endoribonuclease n=1 Tax=Branchiostoma lanceolatum TaxID=7740 RepID=A0A8J9ZZN1_BRALA|nr:ENDOU [Branchiostoma lanceolatum]
MSSPAAFMELLDFYKAETSEPEEETKRQRNKSRAFLNCCLDTDVMKEAHSFLSKKGLVPSSYRKAFKDKLYNLWFELHPRPSGDGTQRSAFEHTFVGETCRGQVLGFHNWVRLYEEERRGNLRFNRCRPNACDDHIITIDFSWNGKRKTFGSFFLGTSPEFELAIYTVCFLAGQGESTKVILGNKDALIVTDRFNGQIGTCYPKIEVESDEDPSDDEEFTLEVFEDEKLHKILQMLEEIKIMLLLFMKASGIKIEPWMIHRIRPKYTSFTWTQISSLFEE